MPEYGPIDVVVGVVSLCHVGGNVVSASDFLFSCIVPRCVYVLYVEFSILEGFMYASCEHFYPRFVHMGAARLFYRECL